MGARGSGCVRTAENERLRQRSRQHLKAGLLTPGEAAKLAGVSNALMHAWTNDINWRAARTGVAKKVWRNGHANGARRNSAKSH